MILALLAGCAVRSTLLGLIVGGALAIFRIRRPETRMASWSVVLLVAIATPALIPWLRISLPLPAPQSSAIWTNAHPSARTEAAIDLPQIPVTAPAVPLKTHWRYGDWRLWMTVLYAAGAAAMLMRIAFGVILTLLLTRDARFLKDQEGKRLKIRESTVLKSPATFGSTIFLPSDYRTWSNDKRRAVLLHEGSHVANRDFYVLILAALYRAAFWFNPFAWWLETCLTDLAEMVADDAAARGLGNRQRYAEILTDLARHPDRPHAVLAMAAPGAVEWRVQRQLAPGLTLDAARRRQRIVIASALLPLALLSTATFTRSMVSKAGGYGERLFIDNAERGRAIEYAVERRVATAPERFLSQAPLPGGEAALREELLSLCCGAPSYPRIGAQLLRQLERPDPKLRTALMRFGAPESLTFEGVGPGGYDIYDARFEHGSAEVRIDIAPDGTFEDLALSPSGDATPGELVTCARERSLTLPREPVLTSLTIVNGSGAAVDLSDLGELGRREHRANLLDGGRTNLWTGVQQPLVVSDAAGQCLGIILPGKATRESFIGPGGVLDVDRKTAIPGGADFLKQYLDEVHRGTVVYDRMTSEAAATLQRQEEHRRVILQKLGPLEDLQFRGVSDLGDDIYRARFANGLCEWRIAFVRDGRVSAIELDPVSARIL